MVSGHFSVIVQYLQYINFMCPCLIYTYSNVYTTLIHMLCTLSTDSCTFCNDECRVVSFDYATIEFQLISSNIRLTLQAEINEIAIKMDETCTHYIFKNHLEAFLNKSGDIALMIQVTGSHKYVSMKNLRYHFPTCYMPIL